LKPESAGKELRGGKGQCPSGFGFGESITPASGPEGKLAIEETSPPIRKEAQRSQGCKRNRSQSQSYRKGTINRHFVLESHRAKGKKKTTESDSSAQSPIKDEKKERLQGGKREPGPRTRKGKGFQLPYRHCW